MNVIVCTGGQRVLIRRILPCPTEGGPRRMLGHWQMWYGTDWTCLGCGDSWSDGERRERPFARGWRQQSIERATKQYAAAISGAAARSAQQRVIRAELAE